MRSEPRLASAVLALRSAGSCSRPSTSDAAARCARETRDCCPVEAVRRAAVLGVGWEVEGRLVVGRPGQVEEAEKARGAEVGLRVEAAAASRRPGGAAPRLVLRLEARARVRLRWRAARHRRG